MSWILAGLTGFVPVFTGIYSDPGVLAEHQKIAEGTTSIQCDLAPSKVIVKKNLHIKCQFQSVNNNTGTSPW